VKLFNLLLPYQRRWINDTSRLKIGLWARQVGKSFATAFESVYDCFVNPGSSWLIMSAGQRQSDEWLLKAVQIVQAAFASIEGVVPGVKLPRVTASEIVFSNGSRILSLPANPDTARGYTANLILDEFAMHEDDVGIWAAVLPSIGNELKSKMKVRVVSTPKGMSNKFADLWHGDDGWSKHKIDIYDAQKQGLPVDIDFLKRSLGDDDLFRQEYLCEFLANDTIYFPMDLIHKCECDEVKDDGKSDLAIGVDIGRSHDLTCISTSNLAGGRVSFCDVETLERLQFAEQRSILFDRLRNPRVRICLIDQTGIGMQLAEEACVAFPGKVEPVTFNNAVKTSLFQTMKRGMEDGRVVLPHDRLLRDDIYAIHRKISTGGSIQFVAPRRPDGHSDRATSIALNITGAFKWLDKPPIMMPDVLVSAVDPRRRRIP
jgi:phage FluMu gp28-like protein